MSLKIYLKIWHIIFLTTQCRQGHAKNYRTNQGGVNRKLLKDLILTSKGLGIFATQYLFSEFFLIKGESCLRSWSSWLKLNFIARFSQLAQHLQILNIVSSQFEKRSFFPSSSSENHRSEFTLDPKHLLNLTSTSLLSYY